MTAYFYLLLLITASLHCGTSLHRPYVLYNVQCVATYVAWSPPSLWLIVMHIFPCMGCWLVGPAGWLPPLFGCVVWLFGGLLLHGVASLISIPCKCYDLTEDRWLPGSLVPWFPGSQPSTTTSSPLPTAAASATVDSLRTAPHAVSGSHHHAVSGPTTTWLTTPCTA